MTRIPPAAPLLSRLFHATGLDQLVKRADPVVLRWTQAAGEDPELVTDIIRFGGVLDPDPFATGHDGLEALDPIDPIRMAKQQGRREFAQELLRLMTIDPRTLANLMETNDEI